MIIKLVIHNNMNYYIMRYTYIYIVFIKNTKIKKKKKNVTTLNNDFI